MMLNLMPGFNQSQQTPTNKLSINIYILINTIDRLITKYKRSISKITKLATVLINLDTSFDPLICKAAYNQDLILILLIKLLVT